MSRTTALVVILCLLIPSATFARTWQIEPDSTGDAPSIQAGIDSAAAGDTVLALSGLYLEYRIALKSGITLLSETGLPDCVMISGLFQDHVFYCDGVDASTVIEGFTITGGSGRGAAPWPENCGGGIFLRDSSPSIRNCRIHGNFAADKGGGVFCLGGSSPLLFSVTFTDNESWGHGGGLASDSGATPTVTNCIFDGNDAGVGGGGAACTRGANAGFYGSVFQQNQGHEGGALVVRDSTDVVVTGCDFIENRGRYVGGAVEVAHSSSARISRCLFQDNSAGDDGGAVRAESNGSFLEINRCDFVGNSSDYRGGGAIFTWGGSHTIENCTFTSQNVGSNYYGGALELRDNTSALVSGCTFTSNHCGGDGGAIYARNFSPEIIDCRFEGNSAGDGGAIFLHGESPTNIRDCVFFGNMGSRGAAIQVSGPDGGVGGTVVNCTFHGNQSNQHGSGIYLKKASPTIENSILAFGLLSEAVYCDDTLSAPVLICSDVFGNAGGDWVGCLEGQDSQNGNLSLDPLFCDAEFGDLTLDAVSPCLNAPGCGQIGAFGQGCDVVTVVASDETYPAGVFRLSVWPNPTRGSVHFQVAPSKASLQTLRIYDIRGRVVRVFEAVRSNGLIGWDGADSRGRPVGPGIYFARLDNGAESETKRFALIR